MIMELNGDERAAGAIDRVAALAAQRAGTEHSDLIAHFTRCYLHDTDVADLEDRAVDDLYGAVLSHWKLGFERRAGAAKVALVNPDMDTSGWRSPHTVVMIVTDDAPFLVDSVRLVLNRHELGIHLMIHPMIQVDRDEHGRVRAVSDDGKWTPLAAVVAQAQVVRGGRHEPLLVGVRSNRGDVAPVRGRHVHELDVHLGQSWR